MQGGDLFRRHAETVSPLVHSRAPTLTDLQMDDSAARAPSPGGDETRDTQLGVIYSRHTHELHVPYLLAPY
jgi:hypothetical protein